MSELIEAWRRETDNWLIVEFEKRPHTLCTFLIHKGSELVLSFGSLGASRKQLGDAKNEALDLTLSYLVVGALEDGWNVSISSLWANLLYYIPEIEESIEDCPEPDLERFKKLFDLFQFE